MLYEVITYESSTATETTYCWVDNLVVTAPDGATINLINGTVPNEDTTWGGMKALFK